MWLRPGRAARGGVRSRLARAHDTWLGAQRFDQPSRQTAYEAAYEAVVLTTDRRDRLDAAITAMAADSSYTAVTRRLGCLRGISTLTGFALAVEIGDWHRFTGSTIGSFVGLVPSENSSGQSRSQGSITKTGNSHARRLLVEAAWHHARPYRTPGKMMRDRWEQAQPRPGSAATTATSGCTSVGGRSPPGRRSRSSPTSPWPASWPGGPGHWRCSTSNTQLSLPSRLRLPREERPTS